VTASLAQQGLLVVSSSGFALLEGAPPVIRVSLTGIRDQALFEASLRKLAKLLPT
jgi:hypothetical protein